ncbi:MAG: hypothetical protein ACMG6E_04700, partial [Candidatus Roizmanbacteria bacterium]
MDPVESPPLAPEHQTLEMPQSSSTFFVNTKYFIIILIVIVLCIGVITGYFLESQKKASPPITNSIKQTFKIFPTPNSTITNAEGFGSFIGKYCMDDAPIKQFLDLKYIPNIIS